MELSSWNEGRVSDFRTTGFYLSPTQQLKFCASLHTGYEEGGLQRNLGSCEAAADTLVVSGVPGFDLRDQQSPVGQEEHSGQRKQKTLLYSLPVKVQFTKLIKTQRKLLKVSRIFWFCLILQGVCAAGNDGQD